MKQHQANRTGLAAIVAAVATALTGCDSHDHAQHSSGGGHKHESAHGGVAVELGEHEFQLDFLAEPATGTLKAWVMDAHAENFVRVTNLSWVVRVETPGGAKELELQAQANATTGEKVGETSQFEGRADWLKGMERFKAEVPSLEVRGKRYVKVGFEYPSH